MFPVQAHSGPAIVSLSKKLSAHCTGNRLLRELAYTHSPESIQNRSNCLQVCIYVMDFVHVLKGLTDFQTDFSQEGLCQTSGSDINSNGSVK